MDKPGDPATSTSGGGSNSAGPPPHGTRRFKTADITSKRVRKPELPVQHNQATCPSRVGLSLDWRTNSTGDTSSVCTLTTTHNSTQPSDTQTDRPAALASFAEDFVDGVFSIGASSLLAPRSSRTRTGHHRTCRDVADPPTSAPNTS
ncbi:uncharacterized protein ACA1_269360 [Acanthamoeba castellanii str. Neff]|uniref:Uncharacterized protein n=1 Tax=Acanthamoeba castellanii (strain ATCC 30010 / Neff) TaxID=1257118 RepID=L8H2S5_ACACF|nr:uncharacterized protein ACA1_269360 [Acanthamoeba castellanii str. Neff]ELR19515.1 hypothetical protein ACA1_269360 [Acanthamoeba castellanii str. Neff]